MNETRISTTSFAIMRQLSFGKSCNKLGPD